MTTSELKALSEPINRLLERVKAGTKLPTERLNPGNFLDTLKTIVDVVCPSEDDDPETQDVTQLPIVNDPRNVELAASMRGVRSGRNGVTARDVARMISQPTANQIAAAKKEMVASLPGGGRK